MKKRNCWWMKTMAFDMWTMMQMRRMTAVYQMYWKDELTQSYQQVTMRYDMMCLCVYWQASSMLKLTCCLDLGHDWANYSQNQPQMAQSTRKRESVEWWPTWMRICWWRH